MMWVLPHALIYWYRASLEKLPLPILTTWENALRFLESETHTY